MDRSDHGAPISLNRLAVQATTHCLIGCGIGEVLGLVIGTALGWTTVPTIVLAVALAFRLRVFAPCGRSSVPACRCVGLPG